MPGNSLVRNAVNMLCDELPHRHCASGGGSWPSRRVGAVFPAAVPDSHVPSERDKAEKQRDQAGEEKAGLGAS